jgi:hypothetical protein
MIWSVLLKLLLNPRVLAAIAVTALVTIGYVHYRNLVSDLQTAQESLSVARAAAQTAISTAKDNAAQAAKADEDRRRVVAELEAAHAELDALRASSRDEDRRILETPEADDGPVAPILEQWRARRYGGGK